MNKQIFQTAALLVAIIGVIGWLCFVNFGGPKMDLNIYTALGTITAEETARLIENKGEVVVISWGSGQRMPVADAQVKAFSETLKKYKEIQIAAPEKINFKPSQMMASGGAISPDELLKILKAHPTASAMVLFLAFPNISGEDLKTDGKALAKFVVVSGYNPGYKRLLMDRVIQLAIVPQNERTEDAKPPQSIRENFDRNYRVITAEQAASQPY